MLNNVVEEWKVAYVSGVYLDSKMFASKSRATNFAKLHSLSMTMQLVTMSGDGSYRWRLHSLGYGFWLIIAAVVYAIFRACR